MADAAVDTTATAEVTVKELKEKKDVEVEEKTDSGDAPANGTNGADHSDTVKEAAEEEHKNGDGMVMKRRRPLLRRLMHSLLSVQLRRMRKTQRQKNRRQRKMEIQKRQKWRLRSLLYLFAALSHLPGQHHVVELVLSLSMRDINFFAPMLSHCTGVLKHSGPASFFYEMLFIGL